ncbi:helix-turn-helix domain-containing protein [Kocuria sp. M1R5S2]|uniref:PucR family transcriptional regulator n=1 Tax=Kocuria rhizosphaerae TaxID=3376285 RepID=UPI00378F3CCE
MDLRDLLTDPVLHLVLHTPTSSERLGRSLAWCAPTELLDPSAYLTTNSLVLTTGMGLNFKDPRTWDAYVERLAHVSVAGIVFSTGDAHREVPPGLVEAATDHDVPLLELVSDVPTLLLLRHVESTLETERFHTAQRTWDLADSCARLAAEGVDVTALLDHIETATGGPVALTDEAGSPLFSSRNWHGPAADRSTARRLPLPGDLAGQCFLVVPSPSGRDIAGPAAAVIAMHVSQALGGASSSSGAAQPFVDALLASGSGSGAAAVAGAVAAAGLDPDSPALALCLDLSDPTSAPAVASERRRARHFQLWRVRSVLESLGCGVRQAERTGVHVLVVQGAALERPDQVDVLFERVRAIGDHGRIGGAMTAVAARPHRLASSVPVALAEARSAETLVRAGDRTLLDLVARSAPIGAQDLARELLDRLRRSDPSSALLTTLETVVRHAGRRAAAAAALGVHRNTLTTRLQRIEALTGWDLADGDTLAALSVALRLARA